MSARNTVRYSFLSLARQAVAGHDSWPRLWRSPQLKSAYDTVVIGGGGHGLATAYYLAAEFGVRSVVVLERSWLGGGNTARNTTIVRSNYYHPQTAALYDLSLRMYEKLSTALNFNIMFSQRGVLILQHAMHDLDKARRLANAMRLNGVDAELVDATAVARLVPALDMTPSARIPTVGGLLQRRGGVARHDAVAWGYARAADSLGVDIIQNCEVTAFRRGSDGISSIDTTHGTVAARRFVLAVSGNSTAMAAKAGFRLPIISYTLQAMVSEPVKPCLDTVVLSTASGLYMSQSDKGELVIGGGFDRYASYAKRNGIVITRHLMSALAEQFPSFGRLRLMRQWAGTIDVTRDLSPILGASPISNLYLDCGWGTGGFKAIPAGGYLLAHHIATGVPHPIAAPFSLSRFATGELIDEGALYGSVH